MMDGVLTFVIILLWSAVYIQRRELNRVKAVVIVLGKKQEYTSKELKRQEAIIQGYESQRMEALKALKQMRTLVDQTLEQEGWVSGMGMG